MSCSLQPLLQLKSNKYYILLVCVFSLRHGACNAHVPYCHMWPVRHYNIFPHYLINGTIFGNKMLLNIKCVLWFYLQILPVRFLVIRRTERDIIKNVHWPSYKVPLFLSDFNESWTFSTDFRKIPKYISLWKSVKCEPSWSMRTDGRTDRLSEMTKLTAAFRNFANARKNEWQFKYSTIR